jgi:large subunit ribosomal protein L22
MEVKAVSKYVRISPQKIRNLIGAIRGMPVQKALDSLKFMPQKSAKILSKVIQSAAANADQHPDIDMDTLVIENILADGGPMLKRFRARARGRGTRILKRTTHITVVLSESSV